MKKIKLTVEYEFKYNPEAYPEGTTEEQAIQIEKEQFNDYPESYAEYAKVVAWTILEE